MCETLPPLERPCSDCRGRGRYWPEDRDGQRDCETCGGAGHVPTAIGEQILALMRHNLRPMLAGVESERT